MTIPRKTFLTIVFAALLGTGAYEARIVQRHRAGLRDLQRQTQQLAEELKSLRAAGDFEPASGGVGRNETGTNAASGDPTTIPDENPVLSRVRQLKQFFIDNPTQQIPELQLLAQLDWLAVAQGRDLGPTRMRLRPEELRFRAEQLRYQGKEKFARMLSSALDRYKREHDGILPSDLAQLVPFFESPPDPAILRRYEVRRSGQARNLSYTEPIIVEKSLADEWYDRRLSFTASSAWISESPANTLDGVTTRATWEFAKTNHRKPANVAEILPYLQDDEKPYYNAATLERFWTSPLRRDPLSQVGEHDTIRVSENSNGVLKAEIVDPR